MPTNTEWGLFVRDEAGTWKLVCLTGEANSRMLASLVYALQGDGITAVHRPVAEFDETSPQHENDIGMCGCEVCGAFRSNSQKHLKLV